MIERLWRVYLFELAKAVRLKSTYAGPLLVLATVLLTPLHHPIARDGASDYAFVAAATQSALNIVGVYMLLIYSSTLIASEISRGAIRTVLVRPILRRDFYAAKLLLGMTYALLLTVIAAGTSWAMAALFGDLGGVSFGGEVIYSSGSVAGAFLGVLALGLLAQFAAAAYGLLISVVAGSGAAAVGGAVGIWLVLNLVKHPLGVSSLMFSTYIEAPWSVFAERAVALDAAWTPLAYYAVGVSLISFIVFAAAGMALFSRRNLNA